MRIEFAKRSKLILYWTNNCELYYFLFHKLTARRHRAQNENFYQGLWWKYNNVFGRDWIHLQIKSVNIRALLGSNKQEKTATLTDRSALVSSVNFPTISQVSKASEEDNSTSNKSVTYSSLENLLSLYWTLAAETRITCTVCFGLMNLYSVVTLFIRYFSCVY